MTVQGTGRPGVWGDSTLALYLLQSPGGGLCCPLSVQGAPTPAWEFVSYHSVRQRLTNHTCGSSGSRSFGEPAFLSRGAPGGPAWAPGCAHGQEGQSPL